MSKKRKVLVVGLDCATPELVFERYRGELPNLERLMANGVYGELESCTPPITVPAWACMLSSRDPGQLGVYDFRDRADYSYYWMKLATADSVKCDRVWDVLSRAGKSVVVVGVPQTYPVKPVNGCLVASFLTPSTESAYTHPPELKTEIAEVVGEYLIDVPNFRTEDKNWLLEQIYEMTEKRFRLVRHLMREKPWDFFMFVEMGPDRIHHGFWRFSDPEHRRFEADNPFREAIRDYYRYLDEEIGRVLELVDEGTAVLVVSDHGARRIDGGIAINEWLLENGYLTLYEPPTSVVPLEKVEVDWSRTKAWGAGGYHGKVFLNVKGREPQGMIEPEDYEAVRDELAEGLESLTDEQGRALGTRVFKPQEIYREVNNIPPDLIVYFGDLHWRAVGSFGLNRVHVFGDEAGPDDANHAPYGIFILHDPKQPGGGARLENLHLVDVAPTILHLLDEPVPADMIGRILA